MALFVGEFDQTIDEKRRLSIPSALREQIDPDSDGEAFYMVLGADRHLWLYPDQYYRRLTARMKRSPLPRRSAQKLGLFFAMARFGKPDRQGRLVIPDKSMQRAQVAHDVTLVGHDDHIEIWPRDEWEQYVQMHLPTYGDALMAAGEEMADDLLED